MSGPLRVGIIGLGVGEQHIAGYQAHPGCEVVLLCDIDTVKAERASVKYPGMRFTNCASEVLASSDIDVVSIASYDDAHAEQVLQGIEHGKHLFVEKPLCLRQQDAVEIRERLRSRPAIRLSSNLILRKSPRFMRLRDQIRQGDFGQLYYLEADYDFGRLWKITEGWRGRIDDYSVTLGGGVHMIDLLQWLSGDEVEEVVGMGNDIASSGSQFGKDDFEIGLLRFRSGMIAKVTANFGCVRPHFHRLAVYGTKATFFNSPRAGRYYTSREDAVQPHEVHEEYPGYHKGALIRSFIDSILGAGPADVEADDVFRSLSVCFAVRSSIEQRKPVHVEYI